MSGPERDQLVLAFPLRREATFEGFVTGPNEETVAALGKLPRRGFAPLTLIGPIGISHLLQATCHAAASGTRAAYLPLRELSFDPDRLAGFEAFELLALDDVDLWRGERRLEEALMGLYGAAETAGATLLLGLHATPSPADFVLADLASRLRGAVRLTVREPDDAGKRAVLRREAERRGLELPREVGDYLLNRMGRDLRGLLALLERLDAEAWRAKRRLTLPFVRSVLDP